MAAALKTTWTIETEHLPVLLASSIRWDGLLALHIAASNLVLLTVQDSHHGTPDLAQWANNRPVEGTSNAKRGRQ